MDEGLSCELLREILLLHDHDLPLLPDQHRAVSCPGEFDVVVVCMLRG